MTPKEAIYFKYHSDAEAIWFTVDGQAFMAEQKAKEHNSTLTNNKRGGAITMRTRAQYDVYSKGLAAAEKASDAPADDTDARGAVAAEPTSAEPKRTEATEEAPKTGRKDPPGNAAPAKSAE
jgi:hypothetical protein